MTESDKVEFWNKQLDRLIDDRTKAFARNTLIGIKKTINEKQEVTDEQVRAIKNIQNGKNIRFE